MRLSEARLDDAGLTDRYTYDSTYRVVDSQLLRCMTRGLSSPPSLHVLWHETGGL